MALTAGQKVERVLKFLIGFRYKPAVNAMKAHGFTMADVEEGWDLLRATGLVAFSKVTGEPVDNSLILELDAWENRWFPIAKATLDRRHPAVALTLFHNLQQQEGAAATLSVSAFLARYEQMKKGEGAYAAEGKAAIEILAERGLNKDVLDAARGLLSQIGNVDFSDDTDQAAETSAAFEKAQTELWKWYLEWSQVARSCIDNKATLRMLGFGKARSNARPEEEDDGDLGEDDTVIPDSVPAGGPVVPVGDAPVFPKDA